MPVVTERYSSFFSPPVIVWTYSLRIVYTYAGASEATSAFQYMYASSLCFLSSRNEGINDMIKLDV